MNTVSYFEIQASNPSQLVTFYKDVFGWNFVREESVPIEYYRIETDGIRGGLLQRPVALSPEQFGTTNAFMCSIEVANFDEVAQHILDGGGKVALPKFAIEGKCWQGYFIDPDKNVFGIFQVDEHAKN